MSQSPRGWSNHLLIVPESVDINDPSYAVESTRGAVVLCRDVLSGVVWEDGLVSECSLLARATAFFYGKRDGIPGRLGARICYAIVSDDPNDWAAELPSVVAGVDQSAESGLWGELANIVYLAPESGVGEAAIALSFPGVLIRNVDPVTAISCAVAVSHP